MSKKFLFLAVLILLIGGVFFVWMKKNNSLLQKGQEEIITKGPSQSVDISDQEKAEKYAETWNGDTNQWTLYQNKEVGIEIRYPEEIFSPWEIKLDNMSVDPTSRPNEFHFELRQKGYLIDDYKHKLSINLHSLKSEKEYYAEREKDFATETVLFNGKVSKIFGNKDEVIAKKNRYEDFLKNGTCDPDTFTLVFDDTIYPTGDFRSYVHVGCEDEAMGKIYQAVFRSISFLDR